MVYLTDTHLIILSFLCTFITGRMIVCDVVIKDFEGHGTIGISRMIKISLQTWLTRSRSLLVSHCYAKRGLPELSASLWLLSTGPAGKTLSGSTKYDSYYL